MPRSKKKPKWEPPALTPEQVENNRLKEEAERAVFDAGIRLVNDRFGPERLSYVQSVGIRLYQMRDHWYVPEFQRPVVWDSEKQIRFCQSVLRGIPLPGFVIWERKDKVWVVDGQQRLTALGVNLTRGDVIQGGCQAYMDFAGDWHSEPGPNRYSLLSLVHQIRTESLFRLYREAPMELAYWSTIQDRLRGYSFPSVCVRDATPAEAKEIFITMTIPGVPMSVEEAHKWANMENE